MTIEEIKEIRATVLPTEQEYFDAHSVEMVDSLLAEVATLEKHNASSDQAVVELDQKLTIATEALERITYTKWTAEKDLLQVVFLKDIARTALERIKE